MEREVSCNVIVKKMYPQPSSFTASSILTLGVFRDLTAEGVLNHEEVSAKEKSAQIKRIYNKAGLKKEKGLILF